MLVDACFVNQDARRCAQLWGSDRHSAKAEARKRRQAAHHGFARVASSTVVSAVAWDLCNELTLDEELAFDLWGTEQKDLVHQHCEVGVVGSP